MSTEISEEELKAYKEDPRIVCHYGIRCYRKNPKHHEIFKHLPGAVKMTTTKKSKHEEIKKRNMEFCQNMLDTFNRIGESHSKLMKIDVSSGVVDERCISPLPSGSTGDDDSDHLTHENIGNKNCNDESVVNLSGDDEQGNAAKKAADTASSLMRDKTKPSLNLSLNPSNKLNDAKEIISQLFLLDMPDDFYKFYDFCATISDNDPSSALKLVDLKLVGPFDVLNGMIREVPENDDDKEKFLRHWRYFYDPPEFQTILKGNNEEGLHYGYWRDKCNEKPIFVAKNSANRNCEVIPVASNIFGAVKFHIDGKVKAANVFEKIKIERISKMLTAFAKDHEILIEQHSAEMRDRERRVVTKTFHKAGIVVPYDKKTQLGYRVLAATDSELHKILDKITKAENKETRMKHMSEIEEVIRMATIAADECDFGTPLELAHDLFSSGNEFLQKVTLNIFSMAYSLLRRPQFSKIIAAHMKDRKKGCDLSVL